MHSKNYKEQIFKNQCKVEIFYFNFIYIPVVSIPPKAMALTIVPITI